jgi:hypothetical protein
MFFLIGADGREYGPFTADQIRDWVAQGRANAHTRIRRDGETSWQALREVPEFAAFATAPPTPGPGAPPPSLSPEALAADYLARGVSLDVGSCLSRGWELVRDNPALTIGSLVLAALVGFALSLIPIVGLAMLFINPILIGGLCYTYTRRIRGEVPSVGDAFSGFQLAFLHLGLAGLVSALLICVGIILCIIPGVYLAVAYTFALPLVIDKKYDFWTAMEVSRRVVHRQWWTIFGLLIVAFLINVVGLLACLVGWIVAAPITLAAGMYAYEDLFGGASSSSTVLQSSVESPV